jgi:uncharacterized protein (TIRG00374 family)
VTDPGDTQTPPASRDAPPPVAAAVQAPRAHGHAHEQMPRIQITRRQIVISVVFVVSIVVFLYFGLPKLVGLGDTVRRLKQGNFWWLICAAFLEVLSFIGYVMLFRAVFVHRTSRINWTASYEITMAGLAATRLFAAAGAGGIALTAWALRRSGMEAKIVAARLIGFNALLYSIYMVSLIVVGLGLYTGLFAGGGDFAITIIPAIFGAVVIALVLSMAALPSDFDRLMSRWTTRQTVAGRIARALASVPSAASTGIRTAIELVRSGDPGLLGAPAWWGFDIATLWASFHAFGASPPHAVIIMAYFVGWIANTLPLPGGIGGVEGGMIGAFSAFGVSVQSAVVAVLAYRAFSFWLPTIPGGVAYFQLRRTVRHWQDSESPGMVSSDAATQPAS